jgi:uncharacterized protein (TIGR02598 family)
VIATKRISYSHKAFSLIEVTLSLAIVAFALLSIMALMPVGLKMMSDSSQGEVMANIITQLRGQFQQLPFTADANVGDTTTVLTLNTQTNWYDVAGDFLTNANTAPASAYYKVTFSPGPLTNAGNVGTDPTHATSFVNGDTTGIATNNAMAINVLLTYPTSLPAASQKNVTNVIFIAKQIGL